MKLNKAVVFSANVSNIPGLCSGANALAQASVAAVIGSSEQAESLLPWANKVAWLGEKAEGVMVESYAASLAELIAGEGAELVLVSNSTRDRCIAAKLAVRLNAGVVTDTSAVSVTEDGSVSTKRNVYGGAAEATVKGNGLTILVVPGGVFDEQQAAQPGVLAEVAAQPEDNGVKLISVAAKQEETVDIAVAKRIVGVGRGLGSQEKLAAVESFAAKLGAEMGCTRPIAEEEHWMARSRYIGVSGATVRPDVYFALGISGQVQHIVGVIDSKLIIAINKDAKAPIFQNCDIGLVADMNKVLPQLTELF